MKRRNVLFVNVAFIFGALICNPIFAQAPWEAEHCHLLPTESEPVGPKVLIDDVVLDGTTDVAESVWKSVVSETKGEVFSGDAWVDSMKEVSLGSRLRNQGYFKADVTAEGEIVSSSPALEHVVVHACARGGTRYTLSGVQFHSVYSGKLLLAIPPDAVRPLGTHKTVEQLHTTLENYGVFPLEY